MMFLVYLKSSLDPSKWEIQMMSDDQLSLIDKDRILQTTELRQHEEKMRLSFLQQRYPLDASRSQ